MNLTEKAIRYDELQDWLLLLQMKVRRLDGGPTIRMEHTEILNCLKAAVQWVDQIKLTDEVNGAN